MKDMRSTVVEPNRVRDFLNAQKRDAVADRSLAESVRGLATDLRGHSDARRKQLAGAHLGRAMHHLTRKRATTARGLRRRAY